MFLLKILSIAKQVRRPALLTLKLLVTGCVFVYDEYLANEHEYEIVLDECARENVVLKMFQNARVNGAYRHACVSGCGLLLYEDGNVNVFH